MSKKEEQISILTSIKTIFHFALGNTKQFDHQGMATNLTNQIIKIISDESNNVTPKEIIEKCYFWLDNTLQPLASTLAYLVKNIIITVTMPFSILFNDITTVLLAIKQIQTLFFELKNFNIEKIVFINNKPEANFLTPYMAHSQAELANINKKLDEINLIRIEIKKMIIKIVDLILKQLTNIESPDNGENPEIKKKISEFILELKSSKEEQSNRVATNLFTTFIHVMFGYKSTQNKQNVKGGTCNSILRHRRRSRRQRRTKTRRQYRRTRR